MEANETRPRRDCLKIFHPRRDRDETSSKILYETETRPRVSVPSVSRPRRDRDSRPSLDDTWLDGPVDVTGWCMKKPGNPVPVGVAAGVSRGVTVAGSLCGRAESAFCVWFSFIFVFWWQLLNLFAVFSLVFYVPSIDFM